MADISGTGFKAYLIASLTYPTGFQISAFPDDADPFDVPELTTAEYAMGLNGDLVLWRSPKALECTINVIPGTEEANNLEILFDANRVAKGKKAYKDNITLTLTFPDGKVYTLTNGAVVSGMPCDGLQSSGRKKTKSYKFVFENKI